MATMRRLIAIVGIAWVAMTLVAAGLGAHWGLLHWSLSLCFLGALTEFLWKGSRQ